MNKRIICSTFFAAVIVLICGMLLISGVLFDYFEKQLIEELKNEADYISSGLEKYGTDYMTGFKSDRRITVIDSDGVVLADSIADAESMDNHLNRSEVRAAVESGSGVSIRYSDTIYEKTIYYAKKMADGSILRICTTQYTVAAILMGLIKPFVIVILIAFVLSYIIAGRISRFILKPIYGLNLEEPLSNDTYEELTPLLKKINAQNNIIEKQLKEARQKRDEFNLITENMKEGFLIINSKTSILTYNSAAIKILNAESVENKRILELNRSRDFSNAIDKALSGSRAECALDIDGQNYNIIINPVFDDKRIMGAVIVILDVTESIKREQLRREFTSNVSHELKTPLTSISGYAEILKAGGNDNETVRDFSKTIYDETQRLISLVNDIISISELDEGRMEYKKEQVSLREIAGEVIMRLRPACGKKGVRLSLKGSEGKIWGVKSILEEIIYNLCDNGIKYNKDGGSVEVIIKEKNGYITVTVKDTGIGIPAAQQERVFERFYRVDKSRSKAIGGTGLGLAIVKHGVACHNGKINLKSKEGRGTEIEICFEKNGNL